MKVKRFYIIWGVVFILTSCSSIDDLYSPSAEQKNIKTIIVRNDIDVKQDSYSLNDINPASGQYSFFAVSANAPSYKEDDKLSGHCKIKDRFDRKDMIAYNFSDGQSKVGLKLDVDGFSLSDVGDFDVQTVAINFRYRFQPIRKKKEKCLYRSSWQGLIGSGYNEFFVREDQTVYDALDEEIDHAHDKFKKLFGS